MNDSFQKREKKEETSRRNKLGDKETHNSLNTNQIFPKGGFKRK